MFDIVRFWMDLGIDGFRLDAVPYLFEEEGTNCENLPAHPRVPRASCAPWWTRSTPAGSCSPRPTSCPTEVVDYFGTEDGAASARCASTSR